MSQKGHTHGKHNKDRDHAVFDKRVAWKEGYLDPIDLRPAHVEQLGSPNKKPKKRS